MLFVSRGRALKGQRWPQNARGRGESAGCPGANSLLRIVHRAAAPSACLPHEVDWIKVKGHGDDELNERCDRLAVAARERLKAELAAGEDESIPDS